MPTTRSSTTDGTASQQRQAQQVATAPTDASGDVKAAEAPMEAHDHASSVYSLQTQEADNAGEHLEVYEGWHLRKCIQNRQGRGEHQATSSCNYGRQTTAGTQEGFAGPDCQEIKSYLESSGKDPAGRLDPAPMRRSS